MDVDRRAARYDGIAHWYDEQLAGAPHRPQLLGRHLGPGDGLCLDVGCGTGRDLQLIASTGRTPVGLEISADQLGLAKGRCDLLVRGNGERLPFATDTFPTVISCWTSTDVDDFAAMIAEIFRVLVPGGRFHFYGVHPCFNGPHVESRPDRSRLIHPTYREARRHLWSPWWGVDGIRTKVGGMRHLPLADFVNAFVDAGLRIGTITEPDDEPVPYAIIVDADKPL